MKINKIFDYQSLNRVTSDTGFRYYMDPQGHKCISVTTILAATASQVSLDKWRERVGITEANRIRDEATGLGTLMHTHLECFVENVPRPTGTNHIRQLAKNMSDQIISRGLIHVDEIWGIEQNLYYPQLWAGTADLCGVHNGSSAIMDYKTTRVMKSRQMIQDYALQLAAYALSHNEVYNTNINKGIIFMVSRDLKFEEFVFEGKEFQQAKDQWIERVEVFLKMQQLQTENLTPVLV